MRTERPTADRVEAAFRILHPHRASGRGSAAWLRRELSDQEEVDVSPKTIHVWLHDGVPLDRLQVVDRVVRRLEERARGALRELEATLGP